MTNRASDGLRTYSGAAALITGGASGIGAALARQLVAQGARVVLADRQGDLAKTVAESLGESARSVVLDVREAEAFQGIVDEMVEREGRIDYFFNNAGIGIGGLFEDHSLEDWHYIIDVNLVGVVNGLSAVYPVLLDQGFGHVVNTASMAGRVGTPGLSAYAATKHAVVGITRSLRTEAAGRGVRVSALCPGVIRTEILNDGGVFGRFATPDRAAPSGNEIERLGPMEVDAFARAALGRVARNQEIIVLPRKWAILDRIDRFFPGFLPWLSGRRFLAEYERAAAENRSTD